MRQGLEMFFLFLLSLGLYSVSELASVCVCVCVSVCMCVTRSHFFERRSWPDDICKPLDVSHPLLMCCSLYDDYDCSLPIAAC